MATRGAVEGAVGTLADAYGRQDRWAEGMARILTENEHLRLPEWVQDDACSQGASGWAQQETRPPTAAELRAAIMRCSRRPDARGCPDCGGAGTREVLRVWTDHETGREVRRHAICACTCERGREHQHHATYTQVMAQARAQGCSLVIVTDRSRPIITALERMGEEAWSAFRATAGEKGWGMSKDEAREDLRSAMRGAPEVRRAPPLEAVPSYHDASEWEG